MVNEKQVAARPGILWVLAAKFFMDVVKSPGLLACCVFPALFLALFKVVVTGDADPDDRMAGLLTLNLLFSSSMVPGTATVYPMAEAREKGETNTLVLAGAGRGQMLVARGMASFALTMLVGTGCFFAIGAPLEYTAPFLAVLALAGIAMTAFSLLLGRIARDQMAASFLSLPIVLVGIAPMFLSFSEATYAALPLLPTGGGFQLMFCLAEGTLFSAEAVVPAIAQLAWAVLGVAALAAVARRNA